LALLNKLKFCILTNLSHQLDVAEFLLHIKQLSNYTHITTQCPLQ